jgi:hypothetical protein
MNFEDTPFRRTHTWLGLTNKSRIAFRNSNGHGNENENENGIKHENSRMEKMDGCRYALR